MIRFISSQTTDAVSKQPNGSDADVKDKQPAGAKEDAGSSTGMWIAQLNLLSWQAWNYCLHGRLHMGGDKDIATVYSLLSIKQFL